MIFVNFKTYQEATGENAVALASIIDEVSSQTKIKIIPVVQAVDLKAVVEATKVEVWVQRIDAVGFGAHTGSIVAGSAFEAGARGTFLNHSENKITDFDYLAECQKQAVEFGLKTLIFASDLSELSRVSQLKPTYVAYEPPEFIGSTTMSVAQAKPEVIAQACEISKGVGIPLIVGAGIHSTEDVRKSLELGASGVALATDFVKSPDPRKELLSLTEGFK